MSRRKKPAPPLFISRFFVLPLLLLGTISAWAGTFTAFGPQTYTRNTGTPVTVSSTFSILNPNTQYTLHVDNSGVSSAVISVNGAEILGPSDFNPNVSSIDRPVSLNLNNEVDVQLRGKPGSHLTVSIIGVDNDPPVIIASGSPVPNNFGWNNTNVLVTFTCSDKTSGVASCPAPVTVSAEGANQVVSGTAVDKAGNTASTSITINLDKTPPAILASAAPPADSFGWNNASVIVTFTCSDALSGVAACSAPVTLSTEGGTQVVTGAATDKAGNTASTTATINIDETPPTISATASPVANAAGWNNTNVSVSFTCSDNLSGVASCPAANLVTTEGANQNISGTAFDKAGNSASASVNLNIDKTPPTIVANTSPQPNAAGWNNTSVTVSFQCSDALSGVATCPSSQVVSTEGANQNVSGKASDKAGNTASASVNLNIDETPPTIVASASPQPNAAGWNNTSVTVSFQCSDALSGVATCPSSQLVATEGANQNISGTASDKAGNNASASASLNIDKTPPAVVANVSPQPNAAGWNNTGVTVSFQCSDALSGVATCPSSQVVTAEGANQNVSGTATDVAGNSNTATATINLDKTPPVIGIASPANNSVSSTPTLVITGTATDALSGVAGATCNGSAAVFQGSAFTCTVNLGPGANAITVVATDVAGNSSSQSLTVNLGPAITDFNPKSASVGGLITVSGSGFTTGTGAPQVVLANQNGGTIAAPVAGFTATSISFVVPDGAASGLITITVGFQTVTSTASLNIIPASDFSLVVGPASANLVQGQSVNFAVTLNSNNGFNQLAVLSVRGVPAGVSARFVPPQITAGQTSLLTLSAPATQAVGPATLTISASATVNGIPVTQSGTASLNVQGIATSFMGRAGVDDALQTPLASVNVTFLGQDGMGGATTCSGQTQSDTAGNFSFTSLPDSCVGEQLVRYDGSAATTAKDRATGTPVQYAGVDLLYTIVKGQVTTPTNVIRLPRIDDKETVLVAQNSSQDQTFTFKTIPNLNVTVYAGTTFSLADGSKPDPFPLIAVDVPVDRLPDEMPGGNTINAFIVAFQPANAVASQPVAVYFPNTLDTSPGVNMDLDTLNPTIGMMVKYGTGTVSNDGTQIVPDFDPAHPNHRFGLVHFDWHGPQAPPPPQNNPCPDCGPPSAGSNPIDVSSGLEVVQQTDISIRGPRGSISIDRTYRTLSSNPGPFGIGSNHNYGYELNIFSFQQGQGLITLLMPDANQFPFNRQPDGTFINTTVPKLRGAVLSSSSGSTFNLRWKDGTVYQFQAVARLAVLTAIVDSNGNTISLTQDFSNPGRITQITDPVGRSLSLSYDGANRITSITDSIGRTVQYAYNTQGTLASVTDPAGGVTSYGYDSQNRVNQITDPRRIVFERFSYDTTGRVTTAIEADGGVFNFSYALANGALGESPVLETAVVDPRGNQTTYRFDARGLPTDVMDPSGQVRTFTRDPSISNVIRAVIGSGSCSTCGSTAIGDQTFSLDTNGNILSETDALENTTSFTYDQVFNKMTSVTDPLGNVTSFTYDSHGNLLTQTDASGHTTSFEHNPFGQVTQITDPLGQKTILGYDNFGNLISTTDPLGDTTSIVYDAISRPVQTIDVLGRKNQIVYDALDRITKQINAQGNATQFAYDANSNLIAVTDANGNKTAFAYDAKNRLAKRTDPLGNSDAYTYDLADNLIAVADRRGQTPSFTYDTLNHLISETYEDSVVARSYDPQGRLVHVDDSAGGRFDFAYDSTGRLLRVSNQLGTVIYTYDAAGRTAARQIAGLDILQYIYDRSGNLISASLPRASASFTYDALNRVQSIRRGNNVLSQYSYDAISRLVSLVHANSAGIINSQSYSYDAVGNRISYITNIAQPLATKAANNNSFDAANHLVNNDTSMFSYDANGNLTSSADPSGTTSLIWDSRNRLRAISGPTAQSKFQYDFAGNLISHAATGQSRSYLLDDLTNIAAVIDGISVGEVLSGRTIDAHWAVSHANGSVEYSLADGINSTVATVDEFGAQSGSFLYEPFGQTRTGSPDYPFQFTGRLPTTEGYYYRARHYNPSTERFLSEDPLDVTAGVNLFTYVYNDPATLTDPLGTRPWYGNYCGPGNNNPLGVSPCRPGAVPAVNQTDACCKGHDCCYYTISQKGFSFHFFRPALQICDKWLRDCLGKRRPKFCKLNWREYLVNRAAGLIFLF